MHGLDALHGTAGEAVKYTDPSQPATRNRPVGSAPILFSKYAQVHDCWFDFADLACRLGVGGGGVR